MNRYSSDPRGGEKPVSGEERVTHTHGPLVDFAARASSIPKTAEHNVLIFVESSNGAVAGSS